MSLRFSNEALDIAILACQLRTEGPLDEVVLACLCELKELRGRITCNDYLRGRADGIDEFAQAFKDYVYTEKLRGNEPYWTVAIKKVTEKLKEQKNEVLDS